LGFASLNSSFSANILKLLSGKILIQGILLVTTPVLVRLFSPEAFGVFQLFNSILTIVAVLSCLQYERTIPLGKSTQEAQASCVLSLGALFLTSAATTIGVWGTRSLLARWFHAPELARLFWFLPAALFIVGLGDILSYWLTREGNFGTLAWSEVGNLLGERVVTIVWGILCNASVTGLFLGFFVGATIRLLILTSIAIRSLWASVPASSLSLPMLQRIGSQYKQFPLFSTWNQFFTALAVQLPAFFFGRYFSPTVVGYYALTRRVGIIPATFIGQAVGRVFYATAAQEAHRTGTLVPVVQPVFTRLVQVGLFTFLTLGLFGASLFRFVFGAPWVEAGVYAQILAGWSLLSFLNVPLDLFTLVRRQDLELLFTVITLIGRTVMLLIGVTLGLPRLTLGLFAIFSVSVLLWKLFWQLRLSGVSGLWALTALAKYALISCGLLLPIKILFLSVPDIRIQFAILTAAAICYGLILLALEPSAREFLSAIRAKFLRV
jgi:lipopolysaccharide exporter